MLNELLDNLNSNDDVTRENALRDASALKARAKLQLFKMAASRYRRQQRRYAWKEVIYIGAFLLWLITATYVPGPWQGAGLYGVIAMILVNAVFNRSPERARRQMVLLGQNINDVRFVIPLLRLLCEPEAKRPDPVLADVLKRLLPQLRYSDTKEWRSADRALLLMPLENRSDPELTLCMLKTLEQVGDETAVPAVERLAGMRLYDPRIAEAARECLPYLHDHVEQLRQAQTLLRATDTITDSQSNLLRPARTDADNREVDELLRANSDHLTE